MPGEITNLKIFAKALSELKGNDKLQINNLTYFARDNQEDKDLSKEIVQITTRHVLKVSPPMKLVGLYVIDSILKNVGQIFRELYEEHIVPAFVHAFQSIKDEKGRIKLHNLRLTWKEIFRFKYLHQLDLQVKEHDPAWPIVNKPDESVTHSSGIHVNPRFISGSTTSKKTASADSARLADVTVSSTKPDVSSAISDSSTDFLSPSLPEPKTTSLSSRDPRLKKKVNHDLACDSAEDVEANSRKRKLDEEESSSPGDDFLIDRDGDDKMEKKARKKGREETKKSKEGSLAFGQEDQDMRRKQSALRQLNSPSPISPQPRPIWSKYLEVHSEVSSRRASFGDIDMRYEGSSESASPTSNPLQMTAEDSSRLLAQVKSKLKSGGLNPGDQEHLSQYVSEFENIQTMFDRNSGMPNRPPHPNMRPSQHPFRQSRNAPTRTRMWNVEVEGLDDMPPIGIDPRLLTLTGQPKPAKFITIDGYKYNLLLDTLQPLVLIDNRYHAVRFRTDDVTLLIDQQQYNIPSVGYTRLRNGPHNPNSVIACLGGPGHELIVDGKPHNVPFNGQVTFINIQNQSVGVQFVGRGPTSVDILDPIPPRILKWASRNLFGSAKNLDLPPTNPVEELGKLNDKPNTPINPAADSVSGPHIPTKNEQDVNINTEVATTAPTSELDIHALFNKLVAAGIVKKDEEAPKMPPDLQSYSLDKFKVPFEKEEVLIYGGHQCVQCGLRFDSADCEEFTKHLDYHYVKNTNELSELRSRNYYQSARHWLISELSEEAAPRFDELGEEVQRPEQQCPAFEESVANTCAVCFEKFETFWDDDEEEWMLRDAVLINGKVYHPICFEDAGKEFSETLKVVQPDGEPLNGESEESTVATLTTEPVHLSDDPLAALQRVLRGEMEAVVTDASSPSTAPIQDTKQDCLTTTNLVKSEDLSDDADQTVESNIETVTAKKEPDS